MRLLEKQQIFGCAVVDRTGCAHLIRVFAAPTPLILPKKGRKPQVVCVLLLVGLAYVGEDVVATALSLVASRVVYISKNKDGA